MPNLRIAIIACGAALAIWGLFDMGQNLYRESLLPPLPEINLPADSLAATRKSITSAQAELIEKPHDAVLNARLGMILHANHYFAKAAKCYERAFILDPDYGAAYLLGTVQAILKQPDLAISSLKDSLALNPDYIPAKLKLAELFQETGEFAASVPLYEELLKAMPRYPYIYLGYGRLLAEQGQHESAIEKLQAAIEMARAVNREFGQAHYLLARSYRALGDTRKSNDHLTNYKQFQDFRPPLADPLLQAVDRMNTGVAAPLKRAKSLMARNQFDQALNELKAALELDPDNMATHANLVTIYGKLGKLELAQFHYHEALKQQPDWPQAHYAYGLAMNQRQQYKAAAEALVKAVANSPHFAAAHTQLGIALTHAGQTDRAEQHYRSAIENEPEQFQANLLLGGLLARAGKREESVHYLAQGLRLAEDKKRAPIHALLFDVHHKLGNTEEAQYHLKQARESAILWNYTDLSRQLKIINSKEPDHAPD